MSDQLKKSINRWAFDKNFDVFECIRLAKKVGFNAIELNLEEIGDFSLETKDQDIYKIREYCENNQFEISSLCSPLFWEYPFTSSLPEVREKGLSVVRKMVDFANILKVKVILVVPGQVHTDPFLNFGHKPEKYFEVYERAVRYLKELSDYAEDKDVTIGVENVFYNKFLMSPMEFKILLEKVNKENVKLYFDVANNMVNGFPEDWLEELGKDIACIHLKDFDKNVNTIYGFRNIFEGDVNWDRVCSAIKKIGYLGYLVGESLAPYRFHTEELVISTSRAIDKIIQMINES